MMLENYIKYLKINGKSKNTIKQHGFFLKNMDEWKPLETWNKDTVTEYILKSQDEGYSPGTIEARKTIFKIFFKWAKKPEVIEDLKIKSIDTPLRREDILEIEDINKLIESTDSYFYKALIALLFESGARINEVLAITRKDISETDKGMIIRIPQTKTGNDRRTVLCIFSAGYIRNYLTYSTGLTDKVFDLTDVAVFIALKKIAAKAGIEKPVSAHKFRHAQAVDMLKRGYQDQITKKKLGWVDSSKMLGRYSHVVDDDVVNATLEKAGNVLPKKPIENLKQAEQIKIADASLQLSKLNAEMEELRAFKKMVEEEFKRNAKAALQGK